MPKSWPPVHQSVFEIKGKYLFLSVSIIRSEVLKKFERQGLARITLSNIIVRLLNQSSGYRVQTRKTTLFFSSVFRQIT